MTQNKKYALAVGSSAERLFCAAVSLLSLKAAHPDFDWDIIFFHNSLTEKQKSLINAIFPCKFVDYNGNYALQKLPAKMVERFSIFTFSKFELFDYLKDYSKIYWLDSDTLVKKNFTAIMDFCDYISMAEDMDSYGNTNPASVNFLTPPQGYDISGPCYNGGMVVFSDKLLALNPDMKAWVYDTIAGLCDKIAFADQSMLNILPRHFNIKISPFPVVYNARPMALKEEASDIVTLHCYGAEKFWNNAVLQMREPLWFHFYNQWLAMGAEASPEVKIKNTKLLLKYFPKAKKNPFDLLPDVFSFIKFVIRYKLKNPKVYAP